MPTKIRRAAPRKRQNDPNANAAGAKGYGPAALVLAQGVVDGARAFLSRVFLPPAEELGGLLQDGVREIRERRALKILAKAEERAAKFNLPRDSRAPARLVASVLENGSWASDDELHDMWAGLLASACEPKGEDESNLVFVSVLSQMTSLQACAFKIACENTPYHLTPSGILMAGGGQVLQVSVATEILQCDDLQRIDAELDRLRYHGLISGGFDRMGRIVSLTATTFGALMYVRCQGFRGQPSEYFQVTEIGIEGA